jgi:hypothetical protein
MSNYRWQMGSDKPEEDFKDMADCVRYAALEQPVYKAPVPEIDPELARMLIDRQVEKGEYSPMTYGLRMRE